MPGIEKRFKNLGRTITQKEYDEVVDYAIDLGVENGFIQEGETAKESSKRATKKNKKVLDKDKSF